MIVGESENDAKKRKMLSRNQYRAENQQKMLNELSERNAEDPGAPENAANFEVLKEAMRAHPLSKTLALICTSTWHAAPEGRTTTMISFPGVWVNTSVNLTRPILDTLEIQYAYGQPHSPKILATSHAFTNFGYQVELLRDGKLFNSRDYDLVNKLIKSGKIVEKPHLKCFCGIEIRFESKVDFLDCLKIVLDQQLLEASLTLFQGIKDGKINRLPLKET